METGDSVRLTRRFDASPERVFDAWLDPSLASLWLFTVPSREMHSMESDAQVGGRYVITDRRDGVDYMALGVYLKIDRPRRLIFTFGMPQFSPEFARVIVAIAPDDDGCVLTVTQEDVPSDHVEAIEAGWSQMFDVLTATL